MKSIRKNRVIGSVLIFTILVIGGLATISIIGNMGDGMETFLGKVLPQPIAAKASESNSSAKATFLDCAAVKSRTKEFLKFHFYFRSFSEELSSRTFNRFFQILDPGKVFFLASDIEKFRKYEKDLAVTLARLDCSFIEDIYDLYKQRVKESRTYVDSEISKAFDFSVDESIETDRKKIPWAKDVAELKNRWRKQFKFMALNMKDADLTKEEIITKLKKREDMIEKSVFEKNLDEKDGLFLEAFATSLDPHSQFQMPADQDDFKVQFSLQLVGIGATLSSQEGYTVIEALVAGGPAARDGRLRKGDKIVAVDSGDGNGVVNVVDMELPKVVQLIRGKKDTVVKLNIIRKDEKGEVKKLTIELVRDVVNLPDQAAKSDILTINNKKVGIILLQNFYIDYDGSRLSGDYRSSANDVAKEILKLKAKNVDGIILDLRRNGGGDLNECIKMTSFFIEKGTVVQTQDRNGSVEASEDSGAGLLYNGPLAILISKQSASASEILSGALKDYGRALILGDSRTFGKGTVQHVRAIPGTNGRESNGALRITVSKFFQPSGGSNQAKGIPSDVTIPDLDEPLPIAEEEYEFYLPHSEISPARNFKKIMSFDSILPELKKRSSDRIAKSKEFKDLMVSIKKAEKERDTTIFPLKPQEGDKKAAIKSTAAPVGAQHSAPAKTGTPAPAATPAKNGTPTPVPTPIELKGAKVIEKDDIQLYEASQILLDSIQLLGKTDWTK